MYMQPTTQGGLCVQRCRVWTVSACWFQDVKIFMYHLCLPLISIDISERIVKTLACGKIYKQNDEAKHRRSTKSTVVGKAKVMSYEDIEEARGKRAANEAAKE